ncbi:hypothetical protein ACFS07_35155 [Undibacterium arcticum]
MSTILWLAFTQIAASGLGGYLAGRLRIKWANVHADEVYFRDTAHGFFAWAVASLATAAFFLTSAVGSVLSGGIQAGAAAARTATAAATTATANRGDASSGPTGYFVDTLFRSPQAASDAMDTAPRQEAVKNLRQRPAVGRLEPRR